MVIFRKASEFKEDATVSTIAKRKRNRTRGKKDDSKLLVGDGQALIDNAADSDSDEDGVSSSDESDLDVKEISAEDSITGEKKSTDGDFNGDDEVLNEKDIEVEEKRVPTETLSTESIETLPIETSIKENPATQLQTNAADSKGKKGRTLEKKAKGKLLNYYKGNKLNLFNLLKRPVNLSEVILIKFFIVRK